MTPCRHWGARMFNDTHRGYGGYVVEDGGFSVYHSGDTAYFSGFAEIGKRLRPKVALLPIGAYFPDSYQGGAYESGGGCAGVCGVGRGADGSDALWDVQAGEGADA